MAWDLKTESESLKSDEVEQWCGVRFEGEWEFEEWEFEEWWGWAVARGLKSESKGLKSESESESLKSDEVEQWHKVWRVRVGVWRVREWEAMRTWCVWVWVCLSDPLSVFEFEWFFEWSGHVEG